MTSTADHRPPLRAVYDDGVAWQRDRQRFAAFLTAKDLVLGYTRTATEGAARLAARLRLGGLFTMVPGPTAGCSALPRWPGVAFKHQACWRALSGA